MATTFLTTNTINGGSAGWALAAAGDEVFVMPNVLVGSTGAFAGITSATHGFVTVHGSVFGVRGIYLNTTNTADVSQVFISATGSVMGLANNEAVRSEGSLYLDNAGTISTLGPGGWAVHVGQSTRTLTLFNTGTITGGEAGVVAQGVADITNHGTITGRTFAIVTSNGIISNDFVRNHGVVNGSVNLAGGDDTITNTGIITGQVQLGDGSDVYESRGTGTARFGVFGGIGDDFLFGSDGTDPLYGEDNNDYLEGNGGVDVLNGGGGDDAIFFSIEDSSVIGGAGTDTAYNLYHAFGLTFDMGGNDFEVYSGSQAGETILTTTATAITVFASGGNDLVTGGAGIDTLNGDGGDDRLFGGGAVDTMNGGEGADTLRGDLGNDVLTGGDGADRFVFDGFDSTVDTITDFTIGVDKIQILRSGFLSPAQWGAGSLDPARFVATANPSPINGTAAFLFDNAGPGVGTLYWNDGSGSANGIAVVQFAPGQNPLFFTAADFLLI